MGRHRVLITDRRHFHRLTRNLCLKCLQVDHCYAALEVDIGEASLQIPHEADQTANSECHDAKNSDQNYAFALPFHFLFSHSHRLERVLLRFASCGQVGQLSAILCCQTVDLGFALLLHEVGDIVTFAPDFVDSRLIVSPQFLDLLALLVILILVQSLCGDKNLRGII